MARVHQHGARQARLVERLDGILDERDTLVALEDRLLLATVPAGQPTVALADDGGDVGDLVSSGFATVDRAAELIERLEEERPHEERLQPSRLGPLHLFLHLEEPIRRHRFLGEGAAVEQALQVVVVEGVVDAGGEAGADLGLVAVADSFNKHFLKAAALEHFAQDIEHPPLEGLAFDAELFEQAVEDRALAGLFGDEVPEMANLVLADAVDAAEALFDSVRIPGQVVVDHQVGALQVHAFAGGVGGDQDAHVRVGPEQGLGFAALVAVGAAVDGDDGVGRAEHAGDFRVQVVERVAVLGKQDDLALQPGDVMHLGVVLEQPG